eukprot:gene24387-29642_t
MGRALNIRRPKGFVEPAAPASSPNMWQQAVAQPPPTMPQATPAAFYGQMLAEQQQFMPPGVGATMGGAMGASMGAGAAVVGDKSQRELFVGNLALGVVTGEVLSSYFNNALGYLQQPGAGAAVVKADLERGGKYAFVEFRNAELATAAILGLWLSTDVTAEMITTLFNETLAPLNKALGSTDASVINCTLGPEGKFAFIELASEKLASAAFQLNEVPLAGRPLNIGLPKGQKRQRDWEAPQQQQQWPVQGHQPQPSEVDHSSKSQRELFVGNLPIGTANSNNLSEFFNNALGYLQPGAGAAVVKADLESGGKYAFVEFRNAELATAAILGCNGGPVVGEKSQRELFVGNLTIGSVSVEGLTQVFNGALMSMCQPGQGLPVVSVNIENGGKYAFVEMRSPELATAAMQLQGMDLYGRALNIGRPKGYVEPAAGAAQGSSAGGNEGGVNPGVEETLEGEKSERELFVGNLALGVGLSEQLLRDCFGAAVAHLRQPGQGLPVVSVNIENGGKYAFVEMRSPELATAVIHRCNHADFFGRALNIGRPKGYTGPKDVEAELPEEEEEEADEGDLRQRELFVGNLPI